jgi:hypothetical protein
MKSSVQVSELCLLSFQRVCTSVRGAKRVAKAGHTLYLWALLLPLGARSTCHLGFEWCGDVVTLTYFRWQVHQSLCLSYLPYRQSTTPIQWLGMTWSVFSCLSPEMDPCDPTWGLYWPPKNGPTTTSAFSSLSLQSNIVHVHVEPSYLYKICLCVAHSLMFVRHCWCFW